MKKLAVLIAIIFLSSCASKTCSVKSDPNTSDTTKKEQSVKSDCPCSQKEVKQPCPDSAMKSDEKRYKKSSVPPCQQRNTANC